MAATASTKRSSTTCACPTCRSTGRSDRQPLLPGVRRRAPPRRGAKEIGVIQMINAYRVRGHLIADLDPLGSEPHFHPELDPETYGLTIWDLDREFLTGSLGEAIGEGPTPSPSPHCAKFWKPCATPTAAKSAAST